MAKKKAKVYEARKFRKQSRIMWMWKENNGYLWLHSLGWTKQQAADFALYPGRAVKVRLVEVPAKRDQNRSNAYADLPGVGRVSHADAHDMAIRFIRRHFDGDRCEKMPLTSIPADPSRDHDIRLLAYIEQQAETEARATAAEARVGELTKALEELYSASCDQQFTLNSRGWNKHPDDASGKNDWAISGAHRHQFDRVQRAVDAADRVLHPEDVEDIARTAPKPQGEERT